MTHDELLAKIDIWKFQTKGFGDTYEVHGILNALLSVVELHRPIFRGCDDDKCCGSTDTCKYCSDEYPCDTIQAIEKELK